MATYFNAEIKLQSKEWENLKDLQQCNDNNNKEEQEDQKLSFIITR